MYLGLVGVNLGLVCVPWSGWCAALIAHKSLSLLKGKLMHASLAVSNDGFVLFGGRQSPSNPSNGVFSLKSKTLL